MSVLWCLMVSGLMVKSDAPVFARIDLADPAHHVIHVDMVIPPEKSERRILQLSDSPFGRIGGRPSFLSRVFDFQVTNLDGNPLIWTKTQGNEIQVQVPENTFFRITYAYRADDAQNYGAYLDSEYAVIFPVTILFHDAQIDQATPFAIEFGGLGAWTVATSIPMNELGRYQAENWSRLAQTMFLIGNVRKYDFDAGGVPHRWTICGQANLNEAETVKAIQAMASQGLALAGHVPGGMIDVYCRFQSTDQPLGLVLPAAVFMICDVHQPEGKNGWTTFLSWWIQGYFRACFLAEQGVAAPEDTYRNREMPNIRWLVEQFFAYYGPILLRRCGYWDEDDLRDEFSRRMQAYLEKPSVGRNHLNDTSFDMPSGRFLPNQDHVTDALRVFSFDLYLRNRSRNKASADDFFRVMMERYTSGTRHFWRDTYGWLEKQAGSEGVLFFEEYLVDSNPLPLEQTLDYGGLKISRVFPESPTKPLLKRATKPVDMGVKTTMDRGLVRMIQVRPGSPAWEAGVNVGDEWIAVSGIRVTRKNRLIILNWFDPGDTIRLLINRNGRILEIPVNLAADSGRLQVVPDEEVSQLEQEIFESVFCPGGCNGTKPSAPAASD